MNFITSVEMFLSDRVATKEVLILIINIRINYDSDSIGEHHNVAPCNI